MSIQKALNDLNVLYSFLVSENIVLEKNLPAFTKGLTCTNGKKTDSSWLPFEPDSVYERRFLKAVQTRDFTFKMIDGALVQFFTTYCEKKNIVLGQKIAYMQSPFEKDYSNHQDYYNQEIETYTSYYGEEPLVRISSNDPISFFHIDYDPGCENNTPFTHSKTHFTFGMHKSARITVNRPVTALKFIQMVTQNFYPQKADAFMHYIREKTFVEPDSAETLYDAEKNALKIQF